MSAELAEKAWDSLKAKEDVPFALADPTFRADLTERAEAAVKTGYTINPFEEEVVKLAAKEKKEEPKTPLHVTAPTPLGIVDENAPTAKTAKATADAKADAKADAVKTADAKAAKAAAAKSAPTAASAARAAAEVRTQSGARPASDARTTTFTTKVATSGVKTARPSGKK